ncbi:hypothetical protein BY996DRAFT_4573156 [Phakopsora pachyrhizi]|uniref:Vacuolar membrane-associated protein IML1 n=1 Tax=Phakopsora pachyrhizi TaxID=170000 RepID=A0AAV0BNP4_PHAPC|nr:hypothetical protein BY996DRAFT_4573156 [Phakopsora pachyrhizi]CAH7687806.1 hypothetical protein PPACK8108_LOCUS22651 [Phakopsora pachyrhizi]CAH7689372.1 hypothetical protein PPACK8108_LOCUS24432 [Phakopsora pachyrhizi]
MVRMVAECFRVTLWIDPEPLETLSALGGHDTNDAAGGIRLNPAALEPASVAVGDLLEIIPLLNPTPLASENSLDISPRWIIEPGFLFTVGHHTLAFQQGLQLSIPTAVAKAFGLEKYNRSSVLLRKVPVPISSRYCADHVELFFRDQYLGRGEMWRMTKMMIDSPAWIGREVTLGALKVKTKVGRVYIKGRRVFSGLITPHTKLIFRTESAKYYLFLQMSLEMWSFEEDGSLYHEKAVLFLEELFERWIKVGTNHLVSIILFSRVFYDLKERDDLPPPVLTSEDGRCYKDFYKVIVDLELVTRPHKVLDEVREEISNFQKHVLTFINSKGEKRLAGSLSYAAEGNILESMGIASNSFDEHYIDRDLRRTGVSIVFVTSGTCVYHVDQMLLRLITEQFVSRGIGVDFVSLAKIPLHVVPLFRFLAPDQESNGSLGQLADPKSVDPSLNPIYIDPQSPQSSKSVQYSVPFFVHCSFFSRHLDQPFRADKFMPRCRMPQIQNGIGEHDSSGISIPLLSHTLSVAALSDDPQARKKARQLFDAEAVGASLAPLISPRTPKPIKTGLASKTGVENSIATAADPKRKSSVSKQDDISQSQLLKAVIPQGIVELSLLANQPSASLSIPPLTGSQINRNRAASASTTGSGTSKTGTNSLLARLTGLSHQKSFWPWSNVSTPTTKIDVPAAISSVNRNSSPTELVPTRRMDESCSTRTISRESSTTRGIRDSKPTPSRPGRSETSRPATSLMPLLNASKKPPSLNAPKMRLPSVPKKFNPSNPSSTSSGLLSQFRRWSAIFPRSSNYQKSLKWKSLTTPACLPITTDFCPSEEELEASYTLTEYELPINDTSMLDKPFDTSFSPQGCMRSRATSTIREAVSQRLSQRFQLVIREAKPRSSSPNSKLRPSWLSSLEIFKDAEKGEGACVDLSLSDNYHRLSIRRLETGCPVLFVQIYKRHRNFLVKPYVYHPAVWWSSEFPGWHEFEFKFRFPNQDYFDYKGLDRIIVGMDRGILLNEDLNYFKTRAVFLPDSSISSKINLKQSSQKSSAFEDESRLSGMVKLQTSLRQVNWIMPSVSVASGSTLEFTDSDASQYVRSDFQRLLAYQDQSEDTGKVLNMNDPLNVIAEAILHSSNGLEVKSQMIQRKLLENVFQGDKFVTFLKDRFGFATREEALEYGQQLESKGLFREVSCGNQRQQIADINKYYQLNPSYWPHKPPRTWFGRSTSEKTSDKFLGCESIISESTHDGTVSSENTKRTASGSQSQCDRPLAMMTRVGVIDLDPTGKSDRSERAIIHCDISHSPSNAWHVEIQWLGITSALVDGLLQQWSRNLERYNIKMVEQVVRPLGDLADYSPFQKAITIPLALKPPVIEGLEDLVPPTTSPNFYLQGQLMRSRGFVLDVEADRNFPDDVNIIYSYRRHSFKYSQYIHCSGDAIVQLREAGFFWADNLAARTSFNRGNVGGNQLTGVGSGTTGVGLGTGGSADGLKRGFIDFCSDKKRLKVFWDECIERIRERSGLQKVKDDV